MKKKFCQFITSVQVVGSSLPILCVQENFVLRSNAYKIRNALPNFNFIIKPAVKVDSDNGRPKNGMFIGVPENFKDIVSDVSPDFWRVQAAIVKLRSMKILIINSYFPVDPRTNIADDTELLETLQYIRTTLLNNEFHHVIWAGDINADFLRGTNHVSLVSDFLKEFSLLLSWEHFTADFTHEYEQNGITHVSTVDHFFWSQSVHENITDCGVIHHSSNLSDHSPIFCKFQINEFDSNVQSSVQLPVSKPCWKKSTNNQKDDFIAMLHDNLNNISLPKKSIHCQDPHCNSSEHIKQIDSFTVDVLDTIDRAAEATLTMPVYKSNLFKSNNDILPGWNTFVKPSKNDAVFWHNVWISAGRPLNNNLHKIMKHTRNIYHYNLRKCKKSQDQIKRNKLLNACLNGNGEIFSEIKKIRQCKLVFPSCIDGVSNDVPNHFRNIYSKLYNSIDDTDELFEVKTYVDSKITKFSAYDVEKVTPEVVKQAAAKLKDGKSDPTFKFSTDCIKNAPDILFRHLAAIFRSYLYHGHVTTFLLLATLVPIIKDKLASINNSKNYRSIAISSLLLKLIDWVALILFGETIGLDDLQFAYQGGASTSMCTWAVMETIGYFLRNGADVFTCQTDMTKAFDLVRHSLLFRKLVDSFFPLIFIRLFIFIYSFQCANVRWNSNLSDIFSLCNGVRQGAVLSGILYCF